MKYRKAIEIDVPTRFLYLTANENILSKQAKFYLSSDISQRYFIKSHIDLIDADKNILIKNYKNLDSIVEQSAKILNKMLDSNFCDFSPLSGLHATICTIATCTDPGDYIFTLDPRFCGHFATCDLVKQLGRNHVFIPWQKESLGFDFNSLADLVKKNKPKMIFLDHNLPINYLPIVKIREVVGGNTLIVYDCSHTLGLIAGKSFINPIHEGCDILQGNTHKTFPGPPKGIIAFKDEMLGRYISKKIALSLVSNVHPHHIVSLYIAILEMEEFGEKYANQIVKNQITFSKSIKNKNIYNNDNRLSSITHISFLDFGDFTNSLYQKLNDALIVTNIKRGYNKNLIRLGFQEVTRLGMLEDDMVYLAELFHGLALNDISVDYVKKRVNDILDKLDHVHFSFDGLIYP